MKVDWYQYFMTINLMFSERISYNHLNNSNLRNKQSKRMEEDYDIISQIRKFIVIIRPEIKLYITTASLNNLKYIKPKADSSNGPKNYQYIPFYSDYKLLSYNKINMAGKKSLKFTSRPSKKGIYNKYSFQDRKKLIFMHQVEKKTLASSAKLLGICQTTARLIVSTWKSEGRVFEKKSEKDKRIKKQKKKEDKEKRREKALKEKQERDQGELLEGVTNSVSSLKIEDNCPLYPTSQPAPQIQSPTGNAQIQFPMFVSPFEHCSTFNHGQFYYYQVFPFAPSFLPQ